MKTAVFLLCTVSLLLVVNARRDYESEFLQWMHKHQKSFHHDEFHHRFSIWKHNQNLIDHHNSRGNSYTLGMNQFGHLTHQEFKQQYLGFKPSVPSSPQQNLFVPDMNLKDLPESLDWRDKGAVTPVKNQEQCGSCWSFSTTGSFEGCHFLATGELVSFSEQNLVDCSGTYGNEGCNGGLMTNAMDYIIANKGLDTEDSYPYTATDGKCQYDPKNNGGTMKSYDNIPKGDEGALQQAVQKAPVSVAIDAGHYSFQFYKSGVYGPAECSSTQLDHGVLAVGWGVDSDKDYWIVKNSWGTTWGQEGYIWMARNDNNKCGIATMATIPTC